MQSNGPDVTILPEPTPHPADWPALQRQRRAIVVVDVVESVRLMQANEADVIDRWRRFVNEVRTQVLQAHGGRLVKSLGDGLLLEFASVQAASAASHRLHHSMVAYNVDRPPSQAMRLRIGVHLADVVGDEDDIYGTGVNLAARLASTAQAGQTVASVDVRDALVDGLDARIDDLGLCFLKGYTEPVRAFRLAAPEASESADAGSAAERVVEELAPSIAVLPFECLAGDAAHRTLGDAVADDVIAALSRVSSVKVVSRLSAASVATIRGHPREVRRLLGVAYIVSGSFRAVGERAVFHAEVCDARDGRVIWVERLTATVGDIFTAQDAVVPAIVDAVVREVLSSELSRVGSLPFESLEQYTLYLGGTAMLYRASLADFNRARDVLEHLRQRVPRSPAPSAMLAKWHVMRVLQRWSIDPARDGLEARDNARRALEVAPDYPIALAIDAQVSAQFVGDLDTARRQCERALRINPNEPQAWLVLAAVDCYLGAGDKAEFAANRALALSPLDPARFSFDVLLGAAKLTADKYDQAAHCASEALRQNRGHLPAHRLLVIASQLGGRHAEARLAAAALLAAEPGFRVDEYARHYPGRHLASASAYMAALQAAGIPR